jgi:hypothetical protein
MRPLGGLHISRQPTWTVVLLLSLWMSTLSSTSVAQDSGTPTASLPQQDSEVVIAAQLDGEIIGDLMVAIERAGRLFVPLCAVAESLSLAITCEQDRAYGFVAQESHPFVADLQEGYVISGRTAFTTKDTAFSKGAEIFVDTGALSQWLPLDFDFKVNGSLLQIHPRQSLPIQQLKKRLKQKRPKQVVAPKQIDDYTPARSIASIPVVDLTSQLQVTGEEGTTMRGTTLNSLDLSGDLLYMSGEAHLSAENEVLKRFDISLSRRRDPAFMVGPIPVSQARLGSLQVPYIDGIGASSKPMYGIYLSNRPIAGSTNFLRHDINGSLPQGWDAELFHNGMPIAYQPPTSENMYHFQNLQVYYGNNDFKVVLHGPFGERRESEETFVSDAITPGGQFLYTVSTGWETGITDNDTGTSSGTDTRERETNVTLTTDYGVNKYLTAATYLVRHTNLYGVERDFGAVGLRTALRNALLSMDLVGEYYPADAGTGGLLTARSSSRDLFGLFSLEAIQRLFWNYDSPQFPASSDPLVTQTSVTANSSFTAYDVRIPFTAQVNVDSYKSGDVDETSSWRFSGGWNGWNGAVEADLSNQRHVFNAGGMFQISTRVKDVSLRGQAAFSFAPNLYASTINLSADKDLGAGCVFNSSISHNPTNSISEFRAGLSKRYGLVGYSFAGTATTHGAFSLTAGMRTSFGVDGANHQTFLSAEPLSPYGMVAVSAVVVEPGNAAGKPAAGIGFLVNGCRAATVIGTKGWPVIANLHPDVPVDVTVDLTTVEDPFMVPVEDGCRVTPRAGVVSACRFTMTTGGEIDGMIFVRLGQGEVPIKDVRVDLVMDGEGASKLHASTRSQETGYYLFKTVKPGSYKVVIPEAELARLKAASVVPIAVTMPVGGDMVSGKDFYLSPAGGAKRESAPH